MTPYNVSRATEKTRREAIETLRLYLDSHTPRKMALHMVHKQLKKMGLPSSNRTLYRWASEFKIKLS